MDTPKATAILRNEHDTILGMLDATEEVGRQLERGERVAPETLTHLVNFFRQFAEGDHLEKEETQPLSLAGKERYAIRRRAH